MGLSLHVVRVILGGSRARSCLFPQFTDAGLQHLGATHDGLERVILRACPLINDNGMYVRTGIGRGKDGVFIKVVVFTATTPDQCLPNVWFISCCVE